MWCSALAYQKEVDMERARLFFIDNLRILLITIVLLTLAIRNITLYPLLEFALVVPVTVLLCFALGNFIRQLPLARRIL
jgi:hypothetical protein